MTEIFGSTEQVEGLEAESIFGDSRSVNMSWTTTRSADAYVVVAGYLLKSGVLHHPLYMVAFHLHSSEVTVGVTIAESVAVQC